MYDVNIKSVVNSICYDGIFHIDERLKFIGSQNDTIVSVQLTSVIFDGNSQF